MAGLPKKFAKFGFKKGWAMFKRSRSGHRMSGGKRRSSRRRSSRPLYLRGDYSTPAIIQRPVKSFASITPKRIVSPVVDLLLLVGGMAMGAVVKKAVPVKNPHLMNGGLTVAGVGGSLMTRNRFVKMPLLGVALQSVISETKILIPKVPLAGDDEVMYLEDMSGEDEEQIEFAGTDDRFAGSDDRIGEYVEVPENMDGEDDRVMGYGSGEGSEEGE